MYLIPFVVPSNYMQRAQLTDKSKNSAAQSAATPWEGLEEIPGIRSKFALRGSGCRAYWDHFK